jgi:hypothetical protein
MSDNRIEKVLKAISLFDVDRDFGKTDSSGNDMRELLSIYFRELIMTDSDISKSFLKRFIDNVHKIIKDMKIIDGSEEEPTDEVDFEPTAPDETEEPSEDLGDEMGDTEKEEIPSSALNDSYDPLIAFANRFI